MVVRAAKKSIAGVSTPFCCIGQEDTIFRPDKGPHPDTEVASVERIADSDTGAQQDGLFVAVARLFTDAQRGP